HSSSRVVMPPPHENAPSSPERPLRTGANPVGDETVVLDVRPVEPEFTGPPISRPGRAKLPIADTVAARSDASRAVVTAEQAPTRAGRFLIIDKLGEGGMGVVYSAYDPELDRRVAIKLIRDGHNSRNAVTRLQREAQAMAKLSHPNVVGVHEVGRVGDGLFVAMDLISGSTLLEWLYAESRTWREIVNMFLQAGHGLAAAHEAGLVHRD
ncbi:MAG: protein kinase, partial [Myxococcales bacterium]|nr:protein kinase [Myxococcales bacterium]